MANSRQTATIIRWIARISSLISISFLLFMVFGHLFGDEPSSPATGDELIMLFFFPTCVIIGLILAWKWDGLGGLICIIGIIGFHLTSLLQHGDLNFIPLIDALAVPALLFLFYWFLIRKADFRKMTL